MSPASTHRDPSKHGDMAWAIGLAAYREQKGAYHVGIAGDPAYQRHLFFFWGGSEGPHHPFGPAIGDLSGLVAGAAVLPQFQG